VTLATALVLVLVLVLGFSCFRVSRRLMFDCGNLFGAVRYRRIRHPGPAAAMRKNRWHLRSA